MKKLHIYVDVVECNLFLNNRYVIVRSSNCCAVAYVALWQ